MAVARSLDLDSRGAVAGSVIFVPLALCYSWGHGRMSGAARWPEYRLADRIKGLHARVLDLKTSDKDCTRLAAWMLGRRLTQLGVSAIGLPGGIDVHVVLADPPSEARQQERHTRLRALGLFGSMPARDIV